MKVLHVYRTYLPDTQGGAQETIRQICLATVPLGIESRVFTPSTHPEPPILKIDQATVHRVKMQFEIASCGFCLTSLAEFKRCVAWADIVHYHFPWPFADILHFMAAVNKPTIVTYHSDIVRQAGLMSLYKPLMSKFLKSADRIVATSPNYIESSPILQEFKEKTDSIPIGLDEDSFPKPDATILEEMKARFGSGFFFFVGVLRYYKGLSFLLEASKDTSFSVVIAGSGPLQSELISKTQQLGLKNVSFAGQVSDVKKMALYQLCRAVVFPSHVRSEAFGVTLIEAAMCGKPMITAEVGTGTSFVNLHEQTGIVVPAADSTALQAAMYKMSADTAACESMGRAARIRYESELTGKVMGERYGAVYDRLLSQTA